MAHITDEDIIKLAFLSKISLTKEEVSKFQNELESIVEYVEQLNNVNVQGLEPTNQVTGLTSVMRRDEVREYAPVDELLKNAPALEDNQIKVKRVLE